MQNDYSDYLAVLGSFYEAAAYYYYATKTNDPTVDEKYKILKERAENLEKELSKLPPNLTRPLVVEHVNKILKLSK